jgi:sugar O-acyltransferase (sialic acid O-acetyltransferase NeuD family)
MIKFDILGYGNSSISMIGNTLYKIYKREVVIRIIKNIPVDDNLPYKITGFKYKILKYSEWKPSSSTGIIIGVWRVKNKKIVYNFFKKNKSIDFSNYSNIIHPFTSIAENVRSGNGVFYNAGVLIGPFAEIGNLVSINRNTTVGHHTKISDFCTINPGCNIAGRCEIGEGVTMGIGANIIDGIKVGENTIVGAGSLVIKDLPPNVVAYGSPAKVIRKNEEY